jgi:peptide/nickel transport system permease protein
MPATLRLAGVALAISLALALPLGVAAAVAAHRGRWYVDKAMMAFVLVGQSMPTFWFGLMLIFVFALSLRLLPPSGADGPASLVLPGVTLGFYSAALVARLTRSNVLESLGQDFVRTARSKGLPEHVVLLKHAARHAAIPVVTVVGLQVGTLLGGAVVTEYVFNYPGVGLLALDAISQRDFPVVQAFVVVVALAITLANLGVDLLYAVLDPRIRY